MLALCFSPVSKCLFPSSLSLSLTLPGSRDGKQCAGLWSTPLKVDLLSWPWSICPHFPSSDCFPHPSTFLSPFSPLLLCHPSLHVCKMSKAIALLFLCHAIVAFLFLDSRTKITLADVAGSFSMHLSCIIKVVDSMRLNVPQQNKIRTVVKRHSHAGLTFRDYGLNSEMSLNWPLKRQKLARWVFTFLFVILFLYFVYMDNC